MNVLMNEQMIHLMRLSLHACACRLKHQPPFTRARDIKVAVGAAARVMVGVMV